MVSLWYLWPLSSGQRKPRQRQSSWCTRGANDVGLVQGDLFSFGANIVGVGTTLGAVYPPTGFTVLQTPCVPTTNNPNNCGNATAFNANRLQPWTLRFENGPDVLTVPGPSLVGTEQPVPFPTDVTVSGTGVTPTIAWTVPGGFTPDGFRVAIRDKDRIRVNGIADLIHSEAIPANATSYTLPSLLSSGQQLMFGGHYTIVFQMIETRNHVAFTNNNAEILRDSSSFFAFSPLIEGAPPNVFLPTVIDGVYNFSITDVGPNAVTFIDPLVAIGYDYATGAGDPNFASVLLPDVGDGQFMLAYLDSGNLVQTALTHDVPFVFPQGGVNAFRVMGIEASAGLDPNNVTAFITGLTFVTQGNFTGTMTPIVVEQVPEPATFLLVGIGLSAMACVRWRQAEAKTRTTCNRILASQGTSQ